MQNKHFEHVGIIVKHYTICIITLHILGKDLLWKPKALVLTKGSYFVDVDVDGN